MFMLKKRCEEFVATKERQIKELRRYYQEKVNNLTRLNAALTSEKCQLEKRLSETVEGLKPKQVMIIKAFQAGQYIYNVCRGGEFVADVRVPINSKNYDYQAKKLAGIRDKDMKGCKAVRWTL